MSSVNTRINTGQQITTDYDVSKIFIWNNRYEGDSYVNNSGYSSVTLYPGTVMGRIAGSGVLVPCLASANDGSQFPIGILVDQITLLAGQTKACMICISGDVAEDKVIFFYGDNLETVVAGRRFRDRIQADTAGVILRKRTEMTDYDN